MKNNFIISRTPYRVSLGGGGTDLPFYSNVKGGRLITASINQYLTVSVAHRPLDSKVLVQTTDVQFANNAEELKHDIIKGALKYFKISNSIQISTFTTIPTSIGLGTSSTLMVGLVKALAEKKGLCMSPIEIGQIAHHVERKLLNLAGGIQDQYISALGGIQILDIDVNGKVSAIPLFINHSKIEILEKHLLLVYTDAKRSSMKIIKSQKKDIANTIDVYDQIKAIGIESEQLLVDADIDGLGEAMDRHWVLKKTLSNEISNNHIDKMYLKLKKLGSPGGKIIGAGGGGFFMMSVPGEVEKYCKKITELGYTYLPWKFEFNGTYLINN